MWPVRAERTHTKFVLMPNHNVEPGKTRCYERRFHIPMLIQWPAVIAPGRVSTLAALGNAPLPSGTFDGGETSPRFFGTQIPPCANTSTWNRATSVPFQTVAITYRPALPAKADSQYDKRYGRGCI
jgi:arylsulfatase A-like enzyme